MKEPQRHDLTGMSLMTPRGECRALFMVDYGPDQESVFWVTPANGQETILRFTASEVSVKIARTPERDLSIQNVQAALGLDHGFTINQLTSFVTQVNSSRGAEVPLEWMPYYRFAGLGLSYVVANMLAELLVMRKLLADAGLPASAMRIDRLIAIAKQRHAAIARLCGVGPRPTDPDRLRDGEENARDVNSWVRVVEPDPLKEEVERLRTCVQFVSSEMKRTRESLKLESLAAAASTWDGFSARMIDHCQTAIEPPADDISTLSRAG